MRGAGQAAVECDDPGQLQQLRAMLMTGERLFFLYDCRGAGSGYLALTNRRLLFQDRGFIPGCPTIVSMPFGRVEGVSLRGRGRLLRPARLAVTSGSQRYEFRFHSEEKARNAFRLIRMWTSPK